MNEFFHGGECLTLESSRSQSRVRQRGLVTSIALIGMMMLALYLKRSPVEKRQTTNITNKVWQFSVQTGIKKPISLASRVAVVWKLGEPSQLAWQSVLFPTGRHLD